MHEIINGLLLDAVCLEIISSQRSVLKKVMTDVTAVVAIDVNSSFQGFTRQCIVTGPCETLRCHCSCHAVTSKTHVLFA